MTPVFLLRHGHIDNPKQIFYGPNARLSERGKRQIVLLAEDLKEAGIAPKRIVASPYARTKETAEIVAAILGVREIASDDRLKEWQVGGWYGKPLVDFYAYTDYAEHPDADLPPDIEPLDSCAARMQAAISDARQASPEETTLIVSHREPMASAILRYQKRNWDVIHDLHFPVASSWEIDFTSSDVPSNLALRFDRSTVG